MATARCELSDLPVDMCAHCLGHKDPANERPEPSAAAGRAVPAAWPGLCASCGQHYPASTTIRHTADGWTADCCAEED